MTPATAALAASTTRENGLTELFQRERRRADRQVALPLALLSTHGLRYLFRRGAVLFARVPLRTALHVAEIIVLWDVLEFGVLGQLLAIRSAVAAFGAFHWGALEPLRRSVQQALARGTPEAAEWETARYLRLAVDFCILELALLVGWLEFGPRPYASFSIFDAYAIGCGLRVMAETITRTYHAGAFALRRVRRPFASLFAVDLVDVGVVLVLWPWLGFWGFGVAQIVGGAFEAVLALTYARRTYRDLPVSAPTLSRILSERARVPFSLVRGMLLPGLANLSAQVDALLVTAFAVGGSEHALGFAAGLHILRPVLSLGSGWARLFYFDLTHLRASIQVLLRARFERLLLRAAPWFALASVAVATLLAVALIPGRLASILLLTPFLLVRSLFAATQVQAFARGAYRVLAVGAAFILALALLTPHLPQRTEIVLSITTLSLALVAGLLVWGARRHDSADPLPTEREPLPPLTFFGVVAKLESPLRLHLLTLNSAAAARALAVARSLAAAPGVHAVTRFTRSLLVVASEGTQPVTPARWVQQSGGALSGIVALAPSPHGRLALAALLQRHELGVQSDAPKASELRTRFAAQFAGGTVIDAKSGELPRSTATPRVFAATLHELGERAAGLRPARRRGLRTAVYAPGGSAEAVFVAALSADADAFAQFERLTFEASLHATLTKPPQHN
jgi:hypothetical protein